MTTEIRFSCPCSHCGKTLESAEDAAVFWLDQFLQGELIRDQKYECRFCEESTLLTEDSPGYEEESISWLKMAGGVELAADEGSGLPRSLWFGDKRLQVRKVLSVSQSEPRHASVDLDAEGGRLTFKLEVDGGNCLVERRPAVIAEGARQFRWVLAGVSTKELYDELLRAGPLPETGTEPAVPTALRPPRTTAQQAFQLIFRLETECRSFAYATLRKEFEARYGEPWWENTRFWAERGESEAVKEVRKAFDRATKLKVNEAHNPLLGKLPEAHIFCYLLLTDLTQVFSAFDKQFFAKLEQAKAGTRDGIIGALRMAESYRNVVAHNRPLSGENLRHLEDSVGVVLRAIDMLESET